MNARLKAGGLPVDIDCKKLKVYGENGNIVAEFDVHATSPP